MRETRLRDLPRVWRWIREGGSIADSRGLRGDEHSAFVSAYAEAKHYAWWWGETQKRRRAEAAGRAAASENGEVEGA